MTKSIHTSPVAVKKAACPTLALTLGALQSNVVNPSPAIGQFSAEEMLKGALVACVFMDEVVQYAFAAGACYWNANDYGHRDRKFHALLGTLSSATAAAGGGMISAVVVRGETGKPGDEFWPLWENVRGRQIPRDAQGRYTDAGRNAAWNEELALLGMTAR